MLKAQKPFVFVLMPFDEKYNDIYNCGIKEACKNAGAYCERVDEQIFDSTILDRIYNQINKADLIIADMTHKNPNVFYETGYAHALGKKCILLTQQKEDIPFDLLHYPHIIYLGKITNLKRELSKKIRFHLNSQGDSLYEPENELQLYSNGEVIQDDSTLYVKDCMNGKDVYIQIDIFNPTSKITSIKAFELALITKNIVKSKDSLYTIKRPDGDYMHYFPNVPEIFPRSWATTNFKFDMGFQNNLSEGFHGQGKGIGCQLQFRSILKSNIFKVYLKYLDPHKERLD